MCLLLLTWENTSPIFRVAIATAALLAYGGFLYVSRAFSVEELSHAREGISFISPFIESWSKRIRRSP